MRKKLFGLIIICIALLICIVGCKNKVTNPEDGTVPSVEEPVDTPEEPETPVVEDPVDTLQEPEPPSAENNGVLSAQKAVEIYLENKAVWMFEELFPMTEYAYYFIDFDLDGVYELVQSDCSGSGSYSSNTYFRINTENQIVEKIPFAEGKKSSEADYISFGAKPLKNRADESFFYLLKDFAAGGAFNTRTTYYKAYLQDGEIHEESLFEERTVDSVAKYLFGVESLSEEEYKEKVDSFYEEHEELSVGSGRVNAHLFHEGSEDEQRQILIEAYPII